MPPEKNYSAVEVMSMNRADRRRIGKANGVKIPGIDIPKMIKKQEPTQEQETINKILDENRNLQN